MTHDTKKTKIFTLTLALVACFAAIFVTATGKLRSRFSADSQSSGLR